MKKMNTRTNDKQTSESNKQLEKQTLDKKQAKQGKKKIDVKKLPLNKHLETNILSENFRYGETHVIFQIRAQDFY